MIQKPAIQLQENSYDCGLFALANATTLCNGFDRVNVIYNPKKMRQHFTDKIVNECTEMFPHTIKRKTRVTTAKKLICLDLL
jgi:hypothetical protein